MITAALCSLLRVLTAIFLLLLRAISLPAIADSSICENYFKLSLQKLECDTISSLPPESTVFDGVETILLGDPGLRAFWSHCGLSGEVPLAVRAKRRWRLGSVGAV